MDAYGTHRREHIDSSAGMVPPMDSAMFQDAPMFPGIPPPSTRSYLSMPPNASGARDRDLESPRSLPPRMAGYKSRVPKSYPQSGVSDANKVGTLSNQEQYRRSATNTEQINSFHPQFSSIPIVGQSHHTQQQSQSLGNGVAPTVSSLDYSSRNIGCDPQYSLNSSMVESTEMVRCSQQQQPNLDPHRPAPGNYQTPTRPSIEQEQQIMQQFGDYNAGNEEEYAMQDCMGWFPRMTIKNEPEKRLEETPTKPNYFDSFMQQIVPKDSQGSGATVDTSTMSHVSEAQVSLKLSDARREVLTEMKQMCEMRSKATHPQDIAFWDRQIKNLSECILKLTSQIPDLPHEELAKKEQNTESRSKKNKPAKVKVRAPDNLPEGYTFTAEKDGRSIVATVPKGGVVKGEIFPVTITENIENRKQIDDSRHENQVFSSQQKLSPIKIEKTWKPKMPTVKVRAPCDLAEGYKFRAKIGGKTVVATVPKGGVVQGEIFLIPR